MELISREEAIIAIEDMRGERNEDGYLLVYRCDVIDNLRSISIVEERKSGHWIDRKELIDADLNLWGYSQICSECGFILGAKEYNYCPNCGARMEEESNGIINSME